MGPESTLKLMVYSKISLKLFWVLNHTGQWTFAHMDEVVAHYSEAREGSRSPTHIRSADSRRFCRQDESKIS